MTRRPLHPALLWALAIAAACGIWFLTCLVEPAERHTLNFGTDYGQMAVDPFALVGKFPHRILSPLLAHWLGLGGERYWIFGHATAALMIAGWLVAGHRLGASLPGALLLATVLAFTGAVQIYKGHVGYPDPMTFFLLTMAMLAAQRTGLLWTLLLVGALHHEQVFFFVPWLCYWRYHDRPFAWRRIGIDAAAIAAVLAAYAGWRLWVGAHAKDQMLTIEHYSALDYFPVGTMGLAALNLLSTYIWFGVLPILVAWHAFVDGWRRAGFGIVLLLVCQHAVFGVAHDVYRFTCFLFVPVMLAGLRLLQERRGWLWLLALGASSTWLIKLQAPVFVEIGTAVLVEQTPSGPAIRQDIVGSIVPKVIPAYWGTFAAYGAALVATVVIGRFAARWSRTRAAASAPPSTTPSTTEVAP